MAQNGNIIAVDINTVMKMIYGRTFHIDYEETHQIVIAKEEVEPFEGDWLSIAKILDTNNILSCEELICARCGKTIKDIVVTASYDSNRPLITLSNGWRGEYSDWLIILEEDKNAYTITLEEGFACSECVKEMDLLEKKQMKELHRMEVELDFWANNEPDKPDWLGNSETEDEFWEHTD